ncbi:MAG TPA: PAS domain S-box protein, partial [Pirellulales bacterium]|nr:PAS domain S-box protein [Pirellulales bacterium]
MLIVGDREEDSALVLNALRQAEIVPRWERVDNEPGFVSRLARPDLPDLILAEYDLPRLGAMRALELLHDRKLDIPLIVLTDTVSEESAVGCIKLGAADYFIRDRLARLAPAILHALEEKLLRDDKRRAEEQLQESERQLRQSEERYRNLVENAPDAILVTHDHQIVYANDACLRLLGASRRKELIGCDILEFIHPDYREAARHLSEQATSENVPTPLVVQQFVRLDGEAIDVELIAMPCVYDGLPAIQGVLRDISDRRRAQEKVQQHLAELAHVTRLRTMGELMSEVSHEINQPLYAISNFAEASLNRLRSPIEGAGPEILSWLEQIAVQANRAGEIIRRIGRFVRKSPAKLAPADVNRIVRDVVGLLSVDVRLDAVELELQLAESLPPVQVDRIQIEQVLV